MTNRDSEPSSPQEDDANIHRVDTVPPPESGDAYSAMTVVREAPPGVLEAIRKRKLEEAVKNAEAAHEKKALARSGEILVDLSSERPEPLVVIAPVAAVPTPAMTAQATPLVDALESAEEPGPVSPPASALASAKLPNIDGYTVPDAEDSEPDSDMHEIEGSEEKSSPSIHPMRPEERVAEHADPSILAIEAAPAGEALRSPFAPPPRKNAETLTLVVIALIALAAGWILSALFR